MESEIDIRAVLELFFHHLVLIIGFTISVMIAFIVLSFVILQHKYESQALVIVTPPRYNIQFDDRFQTNDTENYNYTVTIYNALPSLATSADVLQQVLDELDPPLPKDQHEVDFLANRTSATLNNRNSVIALTVTHPDPEVATRISNTWAGIFVTQANEVYGESDESLNLLTQQRDDAEQTRLAAEEAYAQSTAYTESFILEAKLVSVQSRYAWYLHQQNRLEQLLLNTRSFAEQLATRPETAVTTVSDEIVALNLATEANRIPEVAKLPSSSDTSFHALSAYQNTEIDLGEQEAGRPIEDLQAFATELITRLEAQQNTVSSRVAELDTEITTLQQEYQALVYEVEQLEEDVKLAQDVHLALARKVNESLISNQIAADIVKVASKAVIPTEPVSSGRLLLTLIAGTAGFLLATGIVFFRAYWQQTSHKQSS